jgi:hypothetical protein
MRVLRLGLLLLLVVLICVPSLPAKAAPDTSFNLVTSPLPISLSGPPGSTLTTDIRVKNGGNHDEKLKVSLMKFSAYGDTGKPAIADRGPGDDYFDWVGFSPQSFDAPPNVWKSVHMTIKLPGSAAFGYYYAVVFSRAGSPQKPVGKQNVLLGSTAVLVLVDAQVPNAKRDANIVSFTADKNVYEFLPATFSVKIHNSGNVHLVPSGNVFISKGKQQVAVLHINAAQGNVLPKSNRIFATSWNDGWPAYLPKQSNGKAVLDSADKPVTSLQWGSSKLSKLRFGHYTAHLTMAYDNGQRDVPLEAAVGFWVIPWRLIALVIVLPAILIALVVYLYASRRRLKRQLRQSRGNKK